MWFDRRKLPTRPEIAARLTATIVIVAVIRFTGNPLLFVAQILCCIVIVAVVTAQLESITGHIQAIIALVIMSYVATRTLGTGGLNPLAVPHWYPYPLWMWWPYEHWYFLAILAGSWLLQPLWPVAIHLIPATRKRAAIALIVAVPVAWGWLSNSVGAASAGLITALAVLAAMVLATDRRWTSVGAVACAAFLAYSAFAQHAPPDVSAFSSNPSDIDLGYTGPSATRPFFNTANLKLDATIFPDAASPFGCPSRAYVGVSVLSVNPSSAGNKLLKKDLSTARYVLDVSGATKITQSFSNTAVHSQVINYNDSQETQWVGHSLNIAGTALWFNMPLQSWRSMGTCYVQIPNLEGRPPAPPYSNEPAVGTVDLSPANGSVVNVSRSTLHPVALPADPSTYEWTCYREIKTTLTTGGCPAVAVIETNWSGPYDQVALIVVGALLAIAAERWFGRLDSVAEQSGGEPSSGDGSDSERPESKSERRDENAEGSGKEDRRLDGDSEISPNAANATDAEESGE